MIDVVIATIFASGLSIGATLGYIVSKCLTNKKHQQNKNRNV